MKARGSARCTGSSGLGDAVTSFPAGGGTVREAVAVSRTATSAAADTRIARIVSLAESRLSVWGAHRFYTRYP